MSTYQKQVRNAIYQCFVVSILLVVAITMLSLYTRYFLGDMHEYQEMKDNKLYTENL